MKLKKRIAALLMTGAMICSTLPVNVLAVENSNQHTSSLCEHHPAHTEDCGYTEGKPGTPCNHEHTEDCYTLVTECVHEHTEDCYPAEGVSDNTATPSEPDKAEPTECAHECSEESGCIKKELDCQHEHDEACGYAPAIKGTPCTFVCEECNSETGKQEDKCICDTLCTEDAVNTDCPVCGVDGADLSICKGTLEQEKAECICTALCIEGVVNTDCPICGTLGADLIQCTGKKVDEQVKAVQEQINALPTAEEVEAMSTEEQQAVYTKVQAAYEAYNALTDEQKAEVTGAEIFENLFEVFNGMVNMQANQTDYNISEGAVTIDDSCGDNCSGHTITGSSDTNTITVTGGNHHIILNGVNIDVSGTYEAGALELDRAGICTITLQGSNVLKSGGERPGIWVPANNKVTINGDGSLEAWGAASWPGIGRTGDGNIEIQSGTIHAYGGSNAAGIGGSFGFDGGTITIIGGSVTANGGNGGYGGGAGIGGGLDGKGGTITITGGTVTANGGNGRDGSGSGIGGGCKFGGGLGDSGTFSTGDNGSAIIVASTINDQSGKNSWKGIIVENNTGKVYGNQTLEEDWTIPKGMTVEVPAGTTLTVDATLTVNGTLKGDGTLIVSGTGTLAGTGTVSVKNQVFPKKSSVTVTLEGITGDSADYGSTITIKATVEEAASVNAISAAKNQMEFFVGMDGNKRSLGTEDMEGDTAILSNVTITAENGWTVGKNTITAEYSGSMDVKSATGTTTLTVAKIAQTDSPTVFVSGTTADSITVSASGSGQGGYEYACVKGENASAPTENWQTGTEFSGLASGTGYTVFARYAGNDYYNPSDASEGTTIYTLPEITTANLADGNVGVYYTAALAVKKANDVSVSWSLANDTSLPAGLTLAADGTISGKPTTASENPVKFTVQATINGNVSNTKELSITINKGTPTSGELSVSGATGEAGAFIYGDTITVSGTIKASDAAPAINTLTAPGMKQAALFLDNTQLTEPVDVNEDGSFTIEYPTSDKNITPADQPQEITVKYGGDSNLKDGVAGTAKITFKPKSVTAQVSGTDKVYDGDNNADHLSLSVVGTDLVNANDDDVKVTFSTATYDNEEVGTGKAITITDMKTEGTDVAFYNVSIPNDVTGSITKSGSTLSAKAAETNLTYGDALSVTVTPATTGQAPAVNTLRTDDKQGVELFYEGISLATADTPEADGTYTLTYDTENKIIPIGNALSLTVKFYGDSNMTDSETTVSGITLNKKPVNATVKGEISKSYDNKTDVSVNFEVTQGLEAQDKLTGTATGTFADAKVGQNKSVTVAADTVTWSEDAQWYEITLPSSITGTILKAGTDAQMETYLDGQQADAFVYGNTITVKATLTAKEEKQDQGISNILSSLTEPAKNQAALYVRTDKGDTQLTEPQTVTSGQELTFTYATTDKGLSIGNNTLVVKYVGDENMESAETPVKVITLEQKQITPHVEGTFEKVYDGSTDVENGNSKLSLSGVENKDTVSATASFAYADQNVGTDIAIYITGITLQGEDEGYYKLEKTSLTTTGTIKKAPAPTITYPKAGSLTYGQKLSESALTEGSEEYGTFGWQSPDTVPTVQNDGYTVVFTPSEATIQNYEAISDTEQTVMVTVEKATPELTLTPSAGSLNGGGSVTLTVAGLPDGGRLEVTCSDGNIKPQTDGNNIWTVTLPNSSQTYTFTANYTGDDNHNAVEASCQVVVSKKSSSGGSSSSSNSTIIDRPDKDNPTTPTTAKTKTVKVDSKGNIVITKSMVDDAISTAQADAKKNGNTANGIALVVPVESSKTLDGIQITLKADALDKLVASNVKRFTIDTDSMTDFGFTLDTLKKLNQQTSGDIVLKVKKTTVSSAEAKAAIGTRPAYDISLWEVKNGKETKLTDMTGVKISIALPYTPAKNEKTGNLYAVYVDGNSKVQWITKSSYDADQKAVIFEATQMGVYGIGCDKQISAFTDIGGHWAKEHILFTVSRGLFSGASETTFSPNTTLTRGMFVTALGRLAGINSADYQTGTFTDVKADAYYAPYVNWAAGKGIVSGTTSTTFAPYSPITREQMAVIMKNYADKMGYSIPKTLEAVTFADNTKISSWAKDAVRAMQQAGVLSGKSNNQFDPTGNATRAEAATVLHRFVEVIIDPQTANGWVQNDSGEWSYYK